MAHSEGHVFGIGVEILTIAGSVILYGIFTSWGLGLVYWIVGMMSCFPVIIRHNQRFVLDLNSQTGKAGIYVYDIVGAAQAFDDKGKDIVADFFA